MLDTNILISAALFPNGQAAKAFIKAVLPPYEPVICDYVIDELSKKFKEKFPEKIAELDAFLFKVLSVIKIVKVPDEKDSSELRIRDPKDRPILRSALKKKVELFLTGDKDFLDSEISHPRILNPTEFLNLEIKQR